MITEILKTDSRSGDFKSLIKLLDHDLSDRYGDLQKQYDEHNKIDFINDVIIAYKDKIPVACGAFKEFDSVSVELKRIFVVKEYRQQGLAKLIVHELEELAGEKGYKYALLETGIKQPEAIALYKKCGYAVMGNFGPYIGNDNSVCMKKSI